MPIFYRSLQRYASMFDDEHEDTTTAKFLLSLPIKLAALPVVAAFVSYDDYRWKKQTRKRDEWLTGLIPKALPKTRARSLTPPLAPLPRRTAADRLLVRARPQITRNQSRSQFFRLSPDLRRMVYEEVFRDQVVHFFILLPNNRIAPLIGRAGEGDQDCWICDLEAWRSGQVGTHCVLVTEQVASLIPSSCVLSLLKSCRLMCVHNSCMSLSLATKHQVSTNMDSSYSEAIGVLYSTFTFSFRRPSDLIYMSTTVLPHRWNAIRTLKLCFPFLDEHCPAERIGNPKTWTDLWAIVSKMQGLQYLHLQIKSPFPKTAAELREISAHEELYLRPLLSVSAKRFFVVHVPWPESSWLAAMKGRDPLPFLVVRPEEVGVL